MSIKEKIKDYMRKKVLTADQAYSLTNYGEPLTEEDLLMKINKRIDELIEQKAAGGLYSMTFDMDSGFPNITTKLIDHYTERGFTCLVIDQDFDKRVIRPHLFISWNKC